MDIKDKRIDELIDQGYLMRKFSDDGKLVLFNYSDKCQFDKIWNDITINSRGHIYDAHTGDLVARPFSKFFNLSEFSPEEQKRFLAAKPVSITEKVDGSLGIIYWYDGKWRVNTRGSFASEQSIKATEMLKKHDLSMVPHDYTILAEIIYPENRIVIDYGKEEKFVLLAIFDKSVGELPRKLVEKINQDLKMELVKEFTITPEQMFEWQETHRELDQEGFVALYKGGERVKFKSKRYFEVAKLLANLTYKNLCGSMKDGKVDEELILTIPEEFCTELREMVAYLEKAYFDTRTAVLEECKKVQGVPRKEIAARTDLTHKSGVFLTIDKRWDRLDNYITKRVKENLPKMEKREEQEL